MYNFQHCAMHSTHALSTQTDTVIKLQ